MRKLAQTYSFSASQMDGLEKPAFPPPPGVIVPERVIARDDNWHVDRVETPAQGTGGAREAASMPRQGSETSGGSEAASKFPGMSSPPGGVVSHPVDMEIAGLATLPPSPSNLSTTPPVAPGAGKPEGFLVPPTVHPPGLGGGTAVPSGASAGRPTGIPRPLPSAGGKAFGPGGIGLPSRDSGIVGGRPVAQTPGRPVGGLPRGTVIGGESTHAGRGAMGHGAGMGGARGGNQSGVVGGRRLAGETGGVVGGRPQQPGRTSARPFTPGGTGLVRGAVSGDGNRTTGQAGRGGAFTPQQPRDPRRDENERPDYLVEDEETWMQGGRRVVPPVID